MDASSTAINEVKRSKKGIKVVGDRGRVDAIVGLDQRGMFWEVRDVGARPRPYDRERVTMAKSQNRDAPLSSG